MNYLAKILVILPNINEIFMLQCCYGLWVDFVLDKQVDNPCVEGGICANEKQRSERILLFIHIARA